jgi:hypothetical protein
MKPIKNYNEFINEAWIGPFVFNEDMTDDELKAIYQGALDGFAYWQKGFEYPKADYKKAYTEIGKILKKRGVNVDESVNEGSKDEMVKKEAISRLSDFFRVSPGPLMKFKFDGNDNIKDLTKVLNSTSDQGTELYYKTAIKLAQEEVGFDESIDESNTTINIPNLSDIDHTRIIKWMSNQFDGHSWNMKKLGAGFEIDIKKLSKREQEDLMNYLKSQDYINESEKIEVGVFVRYKKDKDFTGGKIKSIKGSNAEIHNWDGSTTELPLKDLEFVKSWNESLSKLDEGVVKQFEIDYKDMETNIKRGIGWIDPEYVAETWENSSDTIDYELVRNEILTRLIKAGLLYTSQDGETKDKKITNISQIK